MAVSSGNGGIIMATGAASAGMVDVNGAGGVRVDSAGGGMTVSGGDVENTGVAGEQQGQVVVSSVRTALNSTGDVVIEGGSLDGTGVGVEFSTREGSSMELVSRSPASVAANATLTLATESFKLTGDMATLESATVDISSDAVYIIGAVSVLVRGSETTISSKGTTLPMGISHLTIVRAENGF